LKETFNKNEKNTSITTSHVGSSSPTDAERLALILNQFTCGHAIFPNVLKQVITIHNDSTLSHAFKLLIDNKILCVPILDKQTQILCGQISVMGIIHLFLNSFSEQEIIEIAKSHPDDVSVCLDKNVKFSTTRIHEIMSEVHVMDVPYSVQEETKLSDAVNIFVANPHAHRISVVNEDSKIVNIITQSRILQLISCVADDLPKTRKTIDELNLGYKSVVCINKNQLAFAAFQLMRDNNVSAIAATDNNGLLVGIISVNDFKLVGYHIKFFHLLGQTVSNYLELVKRYQVMDDIRPDQLTCKGSDSLCRVIRGLTFYRVHRLFITDDNNKPIGVISVHDILKALLQQGTQG